MLLPRMVDIDCSSQYLKNLAKIDPDSLIGAIPPLFPLTAEDIIKGDCSDELLSRRLKDLLKT